MKNLKPIAHLILIWVVLHLILSVIQISFSEIILGAGPFTLETLFWPLKPFASQCLLFGTVVGIAYVYSKRLERSLIAFVIVEVALTHLCFFSKLTHEEGQLLFISFEDSLPLKFLNQNQPDFAWFYNLASPMEGTFSDGTFIPGNVWRFYFQWIFLTLVYYAAITWWAYKIAMRHITH